MKYIRVCLAAGLLAGTLCLMAPAYSDEAAKPAPPAQPDRTGVHGFDFLFGEWRVHHRTKRPADGGKWQEFAGTCSARSLMNGSANVEEHTFERPTGETRAVGLRAYDSKTGLWAIWWVDGRNPHGPMDPPMKGRFENGIGTFYSDGLVDGKPIRTRFIWSHITATSARWEQAFSPDAGKTWDPNWIMELRRVP